MDQNYFIAHLVRYGFFLTWLYIKHFPFNNFILQEGCPLTSSLTDARLSWDTLRKTVISHFMIHFTIMNCFNKYVKCCSPLLSLNRILTSHRATDMSVGDINHLSPHTSCVFSLQQKQTEELQPASQCRTDKETLPCLTGSLCSLSAFLFYFTMVRD